VVEVEVVDEVEEAVEAVDEEAEVVEADTEEHMVPAQMESAVEEEEDTVEGGRCHSFPILTFLPPRYPVSIRLSPFRLDSVRLARHTSMILYGAFHELIHGCMVHVQRIDRSSLRPLFD
jgi:hypothetical protein